MLTTEHRFKDLGFLELLILKFVKKKNYNYFWRGQLFLLLSVMSACFSYNMNLWSAKFHFDTTLLHQNWFISNSYGFRCIHYLLNSNVIITKLNSNLILIYLFKPGTAYTLNSFDNEEKSFQTGNIFIDKSCRMSRYFGRQPQILIKTHNSKRDFSLKL